MAEVVNTYQETREDGVFTIEELDNGIKIESLIQPSEAYLQKLAIT
ncbi:hypothetical protein [Desulfosporosinus sp. OT]|nr:hypothetical protein [Desulfosporosinus sp. OT]EGW36454.1 hypothetical protein DOT_5618 [Desulfosporosinus sp. OT]